jgi:hypothetical protein
LNGQLHEGRGKALEGKHGIKSPGISGQPAAQRENLWETWAFG